MPDDKDFGQRRRALRITTEAMGQYLGVHRWVYSRWERGRERVPEPRRAQIEQLLTEFEEAVKRSGAHGSAA